MPTLHLLLHSTDINLENYPITDSSTTEKHSLTRYTEDKSRAIIILYHQNTDLISRITECKVTDHGLSMYDGIDARFRIDSTVACQTSYEQGKKNGSRFFLDNNGYITHEHEFINNKKIKEIHYRLDGTRSCEIHYRLDGTQYCKIRYTNDSQTISKKTYYQVDGTYSHSIKYRPNGTIDFITKYNLTGNGYRVSYFRENGPLYMEKQFSANNILDLLVFYQENDTYKDYEIHYKDKRKTLEVHYYPNSYTKKLERRFDENTKSQIFYYEKDTTNAISLEVQRDSTTNKTTSTCIYHQLIRDDDKVTLQEAREL